MEKNWYANGLTAAENEGQLYSWTQTPIEVTLTLKAEKPLRAKELDVVLTQKELKVRLKTGPAGEYLIQGEFSKEHRLDEARWLVEDGVFTVELTKIKRSEWWMSVLKGHKEVTWSQIQPEHPTYVEDLDGDTQAMVKKMMFDNQQRQRGLPTSEDLEKHRLLEQFQASNPNLDLSEMLAKAAAGVPTSAASADAETGPSESN